MSDYYKIGYCGLFCGACKMYIATINGKLEKLSEETRIPVDLISCRGCRSTVTSLFCRNCSIKKCCLRKGLFSCGDCNEFPCSVLIAFENDQHPHHKEVIESLRLIKEKGKYEWMIQQEKRWSCNNCGMPFNWYNTECENCSAPVDGFIR